MQTPPEKPMALKPCPFCGGMGEFNIHDRSKLYVVDCMRCGCTMMCGMTEEDCTKAWNTRVDADPHTSAEPVAWIIGENPNAWATLRRDLLSSVKPGTKVTPLYTHPAPSPDHEPMVQIQELGRGQ